MTALAILNCGQLLTLAGPRRPRVKGEMRELGIVEGGGLLAIDGVIKHVGRSEDIEPHIPSECTVVDANGKLVTPGFVDAHTHLVFGGNRVNEYEMRAEGKTYAEIASAGGGIRSTVAATRAASLEELTKIGRKHARWMLRCGTTTAESKSGYGLSLDSELKLLRAIAGVKTGLRLVPTFLGAHAVPTEFGGNADAYIDYVISDILPAVVTEKLAVYADAFCEPSYFNASQVRRVLAEASRLGLKLRLHADQLTRNGGAELAAELGATTADHLEQTDDDGIEALRKAEVQPVLLPGSVYALGLRRYPDARGMIDAGLGLVISTDFNPGSSPVPSMPFAMSLACTHMQMTPAEAWVASTINAAWSVGLGEKVGSLEPGKQADIVIHGCDDYREVPYWVGLESAEAVWVGGVLAYSKHPQ